MVLCCSTMTQAVAQPEADQHPCDAAQCLAAWTGLAGKVSLHCASNSCLPSSELL